MAQRAAVEHADSIGEDVIVYHMSFQQSQREVYENEEVFPQVELYQRHVDKKGKP